MAPLNNQKIRSYRLHAHHLDRRYEKMHLPELAGACGMQNTPPGAWQSALFNRVSACDLSALDALLSTEKTLLQAWSFRGAPVVFPVGESPVFLSALVPQAGEEWIYTHGISAALDYLGMSFEDLLDKLISTLPALDGQTIKSKDALDSALAEWMLPLIPLKKQALWNSRSMYGAPGRQTVGGAVVSFLLRPCSFLGLVVFGARDGGSPTFTSYKNWLGHSLPPDQGAAVKLARKFLHCYAPATSAMFAAWLGCSGKQARRMWACIADEMETVAVSNRQAFVLQADKALLLDPPAPQRELLLLGGHDPYLDQRDRQILLADKALQKQVWQTIANPGAIVYRGEIVGTWTGRKKGATFDVSMTMWNSVQHQKRQLETLAEEYAVFRGLKLTGVKI